MTAPFVIALVVILSVVIAMVEIGVLTYAYHRLGIDRRWAYGLLVGSIVGALVNVPVARFPARIDVTDVVVSFFGVRYLVPEVVRTGETVLAINVGGALIPTGLAVYLIVHAGLGWSAVGAVAIVGVVVNRIARPVRGVGIVVPTLVPPVVAVAAAALIGGGSEAALAYVGGTLGTLLGADVAKLRRIRGWGAPLVSIGGAGTFDGIFLTGVIAVLLAGL